MVVRPGDVRRLPVVDATLRGVRLRIDALKMLGHSYDRDLVEAATQILIIARQEQAAPRPAKTGKRIDVSPSQRARGVSPEEPHLVVSVLTRSAKVHVVAGGILDAIS